MKSPVALVVVALVVVALICLSFVASAQNVTVQVGARPVGMRSALNLESGKNPPDVQR